MDLIFVTGSFPFGTGETFIENEIGYLAETFEHVYIYTCCTILFKLGKIICVK